MLRRFWGLVAATAAAPFLTSLFMGLHLLGAHGIRSFDDAVGFVAAVLFLGTAGLVIYSLPIAITASLLSAFASGMDLTDRIVAMATGAALGATFCLGIDLAAGSEQFGSEFWQNLISMTPSGAICGWIYWRIAIRRTPGNGHAIDGP